jgi:competence protein ComEC
VIRHGTVTVLIDCGPAGLAGDAGDRVVFRALRRLGVTRVDVLVLTHPDSDHMGGLISLARRIPVGKIVASERFRSHRQLQETLTGARIGGDRVAWVRDFSKIQAGPLKFEAMAPPNRGLNESENAGSLFIRAELGKFRAVWCGDADKHSEAVMAPRHDWRADLLFASHHGSEAGTSRAWIIEVAPQWAIISCGRANSYGHPHPSVLDRLAAADVQVARTDLEGDLTFRFDRGRIERVR